MHARPPAFLSRFRRRQGVVLQGVLKVKVPKLADVRKACKKIEVKAA